MITPLSGYIVDPNNSNGVIKAPPTPTSTTPPQGAPLAPLTPTQSQPQTNVPGTAGYNPTGGMPLQTPTASNNVQTPVQPQSEDQVYSNYVQQGQSIIDEINKAAQSQIQAANLQIDQGAATAQQNQNALAGITGNFGSASAGGATQVAQKAGSDKQTVDSQIQAQAQTQVASYLTNLQSAAQSQANYEQTTGFSQGLQYDQYLKQTATTTLQGLAKSGVTLQKLQEQAQAGNPTAQQSIQTLLQAYGGDQNALNAAAALATPTPTVVQSFTNGSTYNQVVRDPNTNAVSVQSFDLGVNVPTGWTSNKVSTNTLLMQDPNNPGNTIVYTTNPLTGDVQVTGTGTGTDIASQYQSSNPSSGATGTSSTPGIASTTISNILGVDPSTPLTDVVAGAGLGNIIEAMIQNEGGSPAGVNNNPGNVKYTGAPGQIDSGVKATDGGTFASYKTPLDGQAAIADLVNSAASGSSSTYGPAPTLQDFVDKYTNTGSSTPGMGTNGLPTAEYGLLANVQGFDPGPTSGSKSNSQAIDSASLNYLKEYLTQGKTPTAASVGISTRLGSGAQFNNVQQRASDLYYQATGQSLPDLNTLNANKKLLTGNNSILNTLNLQEKTISANSDLLLKNLNGANLNQAAPVINGIIDSIKNSLGDPNVSQYLAQNATISNELGSLLALKNASGTTVHDKLESAGIIDKNDNADQIAAKVKVLMQEAENGRQAIGQASADLYQQIDPLGINPQNPANQPGYRELTSAGFTPNFDGTYTAPDGTKYKVDAQGNVTPQ